MRGPQGTRNQCRGYMRNAMRPWVYILPPSSQKQRVPPSSLYFTVHYPSNNMHFKSLATLAVTVLTAFTAAVAEPAADPAPLAAPTPKPMKRSELQPRQRESAVGNDVICHRRLLPFVLPLTDVRRPCIQSNPSFPTLEASFQVVNPPSRLSWVKAVKDLRCVLLRRSLT
jgi:hypothetical protein